MIDDPSAADTLARFAADLRSLRLEADSPTLAKLQHDTGISRTVLSAAFGGKQLPSARTVDRIVRACDGDAAAWVRRRDELAGLHAAPAPKVPAVAATDAADGMDDAEAADVPVGTGSSEASARTAPRGLRRSTVALLVAAAFLVGVGTSAGVSYAVTASTLDQVRAEAKDAAWKELTDSPINPRAQINVHNGVDPAMTPCVNDAEVATSSTRTNNTLLEIIWSNKCYAGWGRVTRYDEKISGNSVMVAIYPETAPQGPDRQSATEPNVQGAYTTLVVRPTSQTRLCAVGAVTVDGASIDLGEPLCI